jgi:hypothetical protein
MLFIEFLLIISIATFDLGFHKALGNAFLGLINTKILL